jgi:hypothetical protein
VADLSGQLDTDWARTAWAGGSGGVTSARIRFWSLAIGLTHLV